jgi:F0F1-type ATP synthase assembly protein I
MPEQPPTIDEARRAELLEKHVYGDRTRREGGKAPWFRYTSAASVGIEIAVAIVGCTLLARWIELRFTHWSPWTTLIGFAIGVGAAVKALVRTAKQFQREVAERERERERERAEREPAEREGG